MRCSITAHDKNVKYIVPLDKYMYRSPNSANTEGANLSSLCSRMHVLARGSFPKRNISASAKELAEEYIALGFHGNVVMSIINQIFKQHHTFVSAITCPFFGAALSSLFGLTT